MNKQTQDYIVLKPIAERFNKVSSEITDDDIKHIIKQSIREQIDSLDFSTVIQETINNYFEEEENIESILKMLNESIRSKFNK